MMRLIYWPLAIAGFLIGWSIAAPAAVLGAFWCIWIYAFRWGARNMSDALIQLNQAEARSSPMRHESRR